MDKIFKALADRNRRRILGLLRKENLTVGEILSQVEIKQPTVSAHLAVLRKAELVTNEVKGKLRIYKINEIIWSGFIDELNKFLEDKELGKISAVNMRRRIDISY